MTKTKKKIFPKLINFPFCLKLCAWSVLRLSTRLRIRPDLYFFMRIFRVKTRVEILQSPPPFSHTAIILAIAVCTCLLVRCRVWSDKNLHLCTFHICAHFVIMYGILLNKIHSCCTECHMVVIYIHIGWQKIHIRF